MASLNENLMAAIISDLPTSRDSPTLLSSSTVYNTMNQVSFLLSNKYANDGVSLEKVFVEKDGISKFHHALLHASSSGHLYTEPMARLFGWIIIQVLEATLMMAKAQNDEPVQWHHRRRRSSMDTQKVLDESIRALGSVLDLVSKMDKKELIQSAVHVLSADNDQQHLLQQCSFDQYIDPSNHFLKQQGVHALMTNLK